MLVGRHLVHRLDEWFGDVILGLQVGKDAARVRQVVDHRLSCGERLGAIGLLATIVGEPQAVVNHVPVDRGKEAARHLATACAVVEDVDGVQG